MSRFGPLPDPAALLGHRQTAFQDGFPVSHPPVGVWVAVAQGVTQQVVGELELIVLVRSREENHLKPLPGINLRPIDRLH